MKTFYRIFGGKSLRWLLFCITLLAYVETIAQPCGTVSVTGGGTICQGSVTNVQFNISGGTPPWRITYAIDGVAQPEIANINTSPYTLTTGTGGLYTVVQMFDATNCAGQVVGGGVGVTVNQPAFVDVGPNIQSCGTGSVNLSAIAQNYSSVLWTSTGNGTFSNPNSPTTIYYPGTSNISSGSSILTLTVYPLPPCTGIVSDQLTVLINTGASCNAGLDGTSCGTLGYNILGATAQDYSTVLWHSSGTGTFMNSNSLNNAVYYPSPADVQAGFVVLTLEAFGTGNCLSHSVTDTRILSLVSEPIADAGAAVLVCEGTSHTISDAVASHFSALAWTTSGTGTFINGTTLTPTYTPSAADIMAGQVMLTLTASPLAPCLLPATDTKIMTFSRIPQVNAGTDGIVCENGSFAINTASAVNHHSVLWTTSGSGTFSNNASLNTVYTPGASDVLSGTVTLTLTATGDPQCNLSASDHMLLTVQPVPVVSAGIDGTACENSTFTVNTASVQNYSSLLWTSGGTGQLTGATTLTPSYIPSTQDAINGSVTLTLTATGVAPCMQTISDAMQITIIPLPEASAGSNLQSCSTQPVTIGNATASFYSGVTWTTSGTGSFNNANLVNPVYTPSPADATAGLVTLTMRALPLAPCSDDAEDYTTLTITPAPTAYAGLDNTSCTGTYLISGASATNYSSIVWTTSGSGIFSNPTTLSPTYTASAQDIANGSVNLILTVTGNAPCTMHAVDFMVLTLPGTPTAEAGVDASVCEGSSYQVSTASATNAGSINWSTSGSGTFSGQNTLYPIYYPSNQDITNGTVILTMTVNSPAPCTTTASDQMILTILQAPEANAGPDKSVCEGNQAVINGSVSNSPTFTWSTSGDGTFLNVSTLTPSYVPGPGDLVAGSVTITLTAHPSGVCPVSANDQMILTIVKAPAVNAGADQTICNNTYTLSGASATNTSGVLWTTSGTGSFINPAAVNSTYQASVADLSAGSVTLTLTASGNTPCFGSVSDQMVLTFTPQPTVFAGQDASVCTSTGSYTLSDAFASNYSLLTWSTSGSGTFSNTSNINTTYYPSAGDLAAGFVTLSVTATGLNQCNLSATDQMMLSFTGIPALNAGPDLNACGTAPVQITNATATNYQSIYWTHNGGGVFTGANSLMPLYTPSQGDLLAGQVTLTLHAVPNAPCSGEVTDSMVIYLQQGPVVSAGPDFSICANGSAHLTAASASGHSTLNWTSSGTGTFSDATLKNPIYYPSAADVAAGSVSLMLTASGLAPCTVVVSDAMILTINALPVANAGPDEFTCSSSHQLLQASAQNYTSVNWTTTGSGNFVNSGVLNAVYIPGASDIQAGSVVLTLTVNGIAPCNAQATDQMVLVIGGSTSANAGPDGFTCGTSPFMVTGSSATSFSTLNWTSSGTGTFTGQNTLNPVYTPSAGDVTMGSVSLTLQVQGGAPCFGYASDNMILNIAPAVSANAGPDAIVCKGSNHTISGASASNYSVLSWTTSGDGTFVSGNTLTPTYIPAASDIANGSVTLTLTAQSSGACSGGVSDEMLLSISSGATANAGPDASVCFGNNFMISEATAVGAAMVNWTTSGTGTFLNANSLNPTYIPSIGDRNAGSVILTLTATGQPPCLNSSTDFMVLTIVAIPVDVPVINGPQNVCAGQTGVTYSVNPVQYATSYNWTVPSGAVIVSGNNTSSIVVDFQPSAISGIIRVYTSNTCGNGPVSADYAVTVNALPGNPGAISGDDELCQNTSGVAYSIAPVTGATTYLWTLPSGAVIVSGDGTPSILVDFSTTAVSGNITVTPQNTCGNGSTSTLAVTVNPMPATPVITANGPLAFCEGGSVELSAPAGYTAYLWSNGATAQSITVNTTGTYTVVVTDAMGCVSLTSNEITVTVHSTLTPEITASGPLDFCEGGSVTLSAPAGYASYLWSSGQTSMQITVTTSGVYTVTVTDAFGCTSLPSIPVTVNVLPLPAAPVITANGPVTLCEGESVVLSAPAGYAAYLWSNGAATPSITVTTAGNYSVVVTGINGCNSVVSNTITVTVNPMPVISAGSDASLCEGGSHALADASAFNHISVYWTTSGTGIFSNPSAINPTYTPSQADVQSGSVILTLNAEGCANVSDFMVLTLTALPSGTAGGEQDICSTPSPVTGAVVSGYSSLQWTVTFGTGTLINPGTLTPVYQPGAGDITNGYVILNLTLQPVSPCASPLVLSKTLYIHASPVASAGDDETICAGRSLIITTAQATDYTSVQWSSSGTGTWLNANTLNPTYMPSMADIITGTLTLQITASNDGCPDVSDSMVLTIQPELTVNAGPDGYSCEGSNFGITGATASLYSSLLWTTSGSGTFSNPAILNPVYSPGPADVASGSVQLTLTGISASPCTGTASDIMTLYIRQEPQANAGTDGTICQGEQYLIGDAVAYDYGFITWSTSGSGFFLNGNTLTPTYIPSQLDIVSGSVVLTLIASNPPCADISDSQVLTIIPQATVEAGPDVTICKTCSHTVSGAFVSNALSFEWTSTGTGILTGENTFTPTYQPSAQDVLNGSVTLILTAESHQGCGSFSDQMVIYINQNPDLDFTWEPVCEGDATQFTVDPVVTDINAIAVWHWNFGDGIYSNIMNPSHTFPSRGTYNVTLTVTDTAGNSSSVSHLLEIYSSPVSFFSYDTPNCLGSPVEFYNLSSTENGYITRWVWNYGDGTPADTIYFPNNPNVEHTYANQGIFEASLSVMNSFGCEAYYSTQIQVTPAPVANFHYTILCEDLLVNFQDASFPNGAGNIVSWEWDFGDPASGIFNNSNLEDPQHIFSASGTYTVLLTVTNFNNCSDTISKVITVGEAPPVAFTWEASCANALTSFYTDSTIVNTGAVAIYAWTFGDGGQSNLRDPQHLYAAAGQYTVTLTVTDTSGCVNSISQLIEVGGEPVAYFSFTEPNCQNGTVAFNDLSYTSSGYIVTWEWIFGDGNSEIVTFPGNPHVSHQYTGAGTYNVTLNITTSGGCENSVIRQVTVIPGPVANFIHTSACMDTPVSFTDLSQTNGGGNITGWYWNFGDPLSGINNTSVLQNPSHTYAQPGTYQISLIVTTGNSCSDTATSTVTIAPAPSVDFVFNSSCAGDTTLFTSSGLVDPLSTLSWYWDFGDGSTSADPDPGHIYLSHGIYYVSLTITDTAGCQATVSHPVNVVPGPVALFGFVSPSCSGTEVQFNNLSSGNGSPIVSWFWDFGDGNTQMVNAPSNPNVTHIYGAPGAYTVTLTVTNQNGCDASASMTITVTPGPLADFTFDQGCLGTAVAFTDMTNANGGAPVIQWNWNFGDPASGTANTSGLQNPSHIYNYAGTYTVTLTSSNANGCSSTITYDINVVPLPVVGFVNSPACAGTAMAFSPDTTVMNLNEIASYVWNFGDGSGVSSQQNPLHTYNAPGTYQVTLTVTDLTGCSNSVSRSISVSALPVAVFSYTSACFGNATSFTDHSYTSTGEQITGWLWEFNDPNAAPGTDVSTEQHPEYAFTAQGLYNVSLTVTTINGCENTVTIPVQVFPAPQAGYSFYTDACANGNVSFRDESSSYMGAIVQWQWEFSPGYTSTLQNPSHIFYHTDSCYNVRLVVTDLRGCFDTLVQEVCIPAGLEVEIMHTAACHGDSIYFDPQLISPAGDSLVAFQWNFNDVSSGIHNTSTLKNPVHYFQNTGSYLVSLLATDINNCQTTVYKRIDILPLPEPRFSYSVGNCDSTVYFTDESSSNGGTIVSWIWNFGDGTFDTLTSAPASTEHLYASAGMYSVTLTTITESGCSNTHTQEVYRMPCITASFAQPDTTICERHSVVFEDLSVCNNPISQWEWSFGDGETLVYNTYRPQIEHVYALSGNYQVSLIVSTTISGKSVSDTLTSLIAVLPSPVAKFAAPNGCLNANTVFTDQSLWNGSRIKSWFWDFGDPRTVSDTTSARHTAYRYDRAGLYTVTLTVTNEFGCYDTVSEQINVHRLPVADFSASLACQDNHTVFTDLSENSDAPIEQWWWKFSDSVSTLGLAGVQDPHFVFTKTGNYNVSLIVVDTNACRDTITRQITVNPKPVSAFSITENYESTQGRVLFTNGSIGANAYEWNFTTGIQSFDIDPVVTFPGDGTYEISLISFNEFGCPDTLTMDYQLMLKGLWVPNAFSPNNPNAAVRHFKPVGINLRSYTIEVYDTWGNLLWTSSELDANGSPAEGWNGVFNGNLLPQDTYMWKASAIFKDGTIWRGSDVGKRTNIPEKTFGTVTLIR